MKPKHAHFRSAGALALAQIGIVGFCAGAVAATNVFPRTAAEESDYTSTSSYEAVMEFCRAVARQSNSVGLLEFGKSVEGRALPLLVLGDPPPASHTEAVESKKPVALCVGNIHGGEVCGKEALLMLAREWAARTNQALLRDWTILIAPILNADGNERISKDNRPEQNGPANGVGQRANAAGLDLNRDFIKLEAPETRALVRLLNQWDPSLVIDTHATDGSQHRYKLTFEGPNHPAGDASLVRYLRESFLPKVAETLRRDAGYDSFFYGNFDAAHKQWGTYPSLPRYGAHYVGLRNRLAILSEAYSYAPFKERVLVTKAFVSECLQLALARTKEIQKLLTQAQERTLREGALARGRMAVRTELAPFEQPVTIKGFVEEEVDGKRVPTDTERDYQVQHWGKAVTLKQQALPYAYLFPAHCSGAITNLQRHGIEVHTLREDLDLEMEVMRVTKIARAETPRHGHQLVTLSTSASRQIERVTNGTMVVRTGQKLGRLAAFVLEPESEDGLAAWNFFDEDLTEGSAYPVRRLLKPVALLTAPVRPLAEDRTFGKAITFDTLHGKQSVNFSGSPTRLEGWLPNGKQFLQMRDRRMHRVDALTGKATPFYASNRLYEAVSRVSSIDEKTARSIAGRERFEMNSGRTGALFEHENELYYVEFNGSKAARLTHNPGKEELASFSPDGRFVAFVRSNNLHVVNVHTQIERALTTDGGGDIRNGKADWVYFEELHNRNWKAYWWSPDSAQIAFERFDNSALPLFHALDSLPLHGKLESMRHPKAGDTNPAVKLGLVRVSGGAIHWADLNAYAREDFLISHVGWLPKSDRVYCHLQDRIQTWLDFVLWDPASGQVDTWFRDKTGAWIESLGEAHFLRNGDLLVRSDRNGWHHLYKFHSKRKSWDQVTAGEWEVRTVHLVDQKRGWIYFSGTKDSPIAENLYRCKLDGSAFERLTAREGHHRVSVSPAGNLFVDHASDYATPERVALYETDGSYVRLLDANPVYAWEEFEAGESSLFQIPAKDGFVFEAALVKPASFSEGEKYPVWFTTYAGPHAPTIRNAWSGSSRAYDHMLAGMGLVVFRMDPRSASGKGSCSAWTAYRQLGVQELKDISEAIEWLKAKPFIDSSRIGMSGHSYGGFMTAYALTHSQLFAAGIAGAPVTDWRYYDSIYTERYMDLPRNNAAGYDRSSVVTAAKNLHGRLLLLHGMMDDNVHLQNATALMDALHKADREFEVMFYPQMLHGLHGTHYQRGLLNFMRRSLKLDPQ